MGSENTWTAEKPRKGSGAAPGRGWPEARPRLVASSQDIHRAPPHSVEAEQGVIGSILVTAQYEKARLDETIEEIRAAIEPDWFYIPAHQTIYGELLGLHENKQAIDLITFTQKLRDKNVLEQVGGAAFVTSLFTFVPTSANVGYYLAIVRDKFILRQLIAAGTETVRRAFEEQDEIETLVDDAQQKFTDIALEGKPQESSIHHIRESVDEALLEFNNAFNHRGRTQGLATGFPRLDRMTSGLKGGQVIVVGASTSQGKSAWAMNVAENVALDRFRKADGKFTDKLAYKGQPVLVFSLEMSRLEITQREMCSHAGVPLQKTRDGFFGQEEVDRLFATAQKLRKAPIFFDDTSGLRIFELAARVRRMVVKEGVKLVIVDYVQLMRGASKRAQEDMRVEVTEISRTIKELARDLDVPFIVLAQLNREPDKRVEGRPRRSDLKESGSLEQDADIVILLWRKYPFTKNPEDKDHAQLLLEKQRNGPVGEIDLEFLSELTRFETPGYDDPDKEERLYSNDPIHRQQMDDL